MDEIQSSAPAKMICPKCGNEADARAFFCINCGTALRDKTLSTSVGMQIWIYFVSVAFPPLGLWPGIKYFRSADQKAQQIGMVAIILTIVSAIVTVWLTFAFLNTYLGQYNQLLNSY